MAYQLEKWIWQETDFDQMGWHDATIYAMEFGNSVCFDIDYIFEWVQADEDDFFTFVIAPATLLFPDPASVSVNLNYRPNRQLEIQDMYRRITNTGATEWYIETHQGDISIRAESFCQIIRRPPTQQIDQQIPFEERGHSNFGTVPDTTFDEPKEVKNLKKADFALREKASELRRLRRQLEVLSEQRNAGILEVKQYLLGKREVEAKIYLLRNDLKGTQWFGLF